MDWNFPFQRTGDFPIDRSSVFSSYKDAKNYAKGFNKNGLPLDERGLGGTSYVGQIISVYDKNEDGEETITAYIINEKRQLQKLAEGEGSSGTITTVAGNYVASYDPETQVLSLSPSSEEQTQISYSGGILSFVDLVQEN